MILPKVFCMISNRVQFDRNDYRKNEKQFSEVEKKQIY